MVCSYCGYKNKAGVNTCLRCGAPLCAQRDLCSMCGGCAKRNLRDRFPVLLLVRQLIDRHSWFQSRS